MGDSYIQQLQVLGKEKVASNLLNQMTHHFFESYD